MTSRRVLGGYIDNAALHRAQRAVEQAIETTRRLHARAEATGDGALFRHIASLAQAHSEIVEAIGTMKEIRYQKGEE